ncbi:MAG TPA: PEP-CTERM sorting domain-containing protein [Myxococcota bacterium]|nr:PEP-CTERM sorting domain-containing protein [Myxococcota bacterium]
MAWNHSGRWTAWVGALVLAIVGSTFAPTLALGVSTGTFNIDGTLTISGTAPQIRFEADQPPFTANKAQVGATGATGSFAGIAGTTVSIQNVSNPPAVTGGAGFPPQSFLSFDAMPGLGTLQLNFVFAGVNPSAPCALAPAVGQACALPGSPFDFQNTPGGGSRLGFVVSGISNPAGSTWVGSFSSQFMVPYQIVFATLEGGGTVTSTYSASFNVVVPEPTSLALVLGGLGILVGVSRRRTPH